MNWISELCDLYEKNKDLAGKMTYKIRKTKTGEEKTPLVLLPVFHTTVTAQITVVIDDKGEFLRADKVAEDDKITIIPVTEKSGSRTAGPEPHPLCDCLKYLAGDYMSYYRAGVKEKDFSQTSRLYMTALKRWNDSPYAHSKVKAIYLYLRKASLMGDLAEAGILKLEEDGFLSDKENLQNASQADAFVRFRIEEVVDKDAVLFGSRDISYHTECWLDETLQESYIEYYRATLTETDLCYLTGEETPISYLQPKKIRNEGDNSKLISSNDGSSFTYRGRFRDKTEAFAIGFETSQKAHNALKWIIRKQGNNWDGLCTVIWESFLKPIPEWNQDTDSIVEHLLDDSNGWADEEWEEDNSQEYKGTSEEVAARFRSALQGYGRYLGDTSRVVLLGFDAATTGRLAMTECIELDSARYLDNIRYWHESCSWVHNKFKNGERFEFAGMVSVKEIAEILYGSEQKGMLSLAGKTRMYAQICKRMLPCIMNRKPIPADLVKLAVHKASSPVSYDKRYNWERVLALTCSLVKKQMMDRDEHRKQCRSAETQQKDECRNREEWTVALNTECDDRNYLYGRLLAVADRIEYRTFDKEKDGSRVTNAKRFMCSFSQRPFHTWKVIEEKIQPYLAKLKPGERIFYCKHLDEIYDRFTVDSFDNKDSLNGMYLLGFHSQAYSFINDKERNHEEENG